MKLNNDIYSNLLESRMLRDNDEIEKYEHNLELLAESFNERDIIELCSTFEDKTHNSEVMFGAVHLLETLSSELAFENTIKGVVSLYNSSPEWANIIIYRCLNDEFSVQMIKKVYSRLGNKISSQFKKMLEEIKKDDFDRFGKTVDEILTSFYR